MQQIKITFRVVGKEMVLPINYQYEFSSFFYTIFSSYSEKFSEKLHKDGLKVPKKDGKRFKHFTFSNIKNTKITARYDRLTLENNTFDIFLHSLLPQASFAMRKTAILGDTFSIGDKFSRIDVKITNVEVMPDLKWDTKMAYQTVSPICESLKVGSFQSYLSPEDVEFESVLMHNLLDKYKSFYPHKQDISQERLSFRLLDRKIKSRLTRIKAFTPEETKIKSYFCRFTLTAPIELQKVAFYSGLGQYNAMGFGALQNIRNYER